MNRPIHNSKVLFTLLVPFFSSKKEKKSMKNLSLVGNDRMITHGQVRVKSTLPSIALKYNKILFKKCCRFSVFLFLDLHIWQIPREMLQFLLFHSVVRIIRKYDALLPQRCLFFLWVFRFWFLPFPDFKPVCLLVFFFAWAEVVVGPT